MTTSDGGDRKIGGILQQLMSSQRFGDRRRRPDARATAMGIPIIAQPDGGFVVDMSSVRLLSGLPALTRMLGNEMIQQAADSTVDVMLRQRIDSDATPELAGLGIGQVAIYARNPVAKRLAAAPAELHRILRLAFETIQGAKWGGLLFPEHMPSGDSTSRDDVKALLFQFSLPADNFRCVLLLERERDGGFLRLTFEPADESRLFLKRIAHRAVPEAAHACSLEDIVSIAAQLEGAIIRECENQRGDLKLAPGHHDSLFVLLADAGLPQVTEIRFSWPLDSFNEEALTGAKGQVTDLLARVLLLLQDQAVAAVLAENQVLQMKAGARSVFMDLSRRGSCLQISMGGRRTNARIERYLEELPVLRAAAENAAGVLAPFRVVLIHHITAEVLALIKALDLSGCASLQTLFIRYKAAVADDLLEAILAMPEERFSFHALQKVDAADLVEGYYVLSRRYSDVAPLKTLDQQLRKERAGFIRSMRVAAMRLFLQEARAAKKAGQKVLLIEDGGYVAPVINKFCLEDRAMGELLAEYGIPPADLGLEQEADQAVEEWLRGVVAGTVEHTRNGYDKLSALTAEHGRLSFPAASIAVSKVKNVEEARECAVTLLQAIEAIFFGQGRILSSRNALVLGSRGNIGRCLARHLSFRLHSGRLLGVDLLADAQGVQAQPGTVEIAEAKSLAELPEDALLDVDLVIGTVGASLMTDEWIEKLVLDGRRRDIFFASASTKTAEYEHLASWLQRLRESPEPSIAGRPVRVTQHAIRDPQTGLNQGSRARIEFLDNNAVMPWKDMYLLADLTPVNFLYYGVPAEIIDLIMAQLLRLTAGFARAVMSRAVAPALYAVDAEVDDDFEPLGQRRQ